MGEGHRLCGHQGGLSGAHRPIGDGGFSVVSARKAGMCKLRTTVAGFLLAPCLAIGAYAQSTIQLSGQARTQVIATPNGGYVLHTPGQMPMNITPRPDGSYVIQTPGQKPSYAIPRGGGAYALQTPGQMPLYVTPMPGGGVTMQTPGQTPTFVSPSASGGYAIHAPGQVPSFLYAVPGVMR
jgi:hypothetical protein